MEKIAEDIVEIADEIPLAEFPMADGTTAQRVDNGAIQRNKLRVDTRKWIMSKLAPKKYGDSSKIELSGEVNIGLAERIAKARARES